MADKKKPSDDTRIEFGKTINREKIDLGTQQPKPTAEGNKKKPPKN